jgi:hypothetical protein
MPFILQHRSRVVALNNFLRQRYLIVPGHKILMRESPLTDPDHKKARDQLALSDTV